MRTLPVIIACILIVISFPNSSSAGPLFAVSLENMTANCLSTWHKEILAYGNLGKNAVDTMCMPHAWYLSADIQLYALSFGLILLLFKRPVIGVPLSVGLVFSSFAALIWYIGGPLKGFPGDLDFDVGRRLLYKNHFDPINHYGSYVIGLLLGFFMAKDYSLPRKWLPYIYCLALQVYTLTLTVPMFILALPDEVPSIIESTEVGSLIVDYFRHRPTLVYYMQWINISVQRQNFSASFSFICFLLFAKTKPQQSCDAKYKEEGIKDYKLIQVILTSIETYSSTMMDAVISNLSNKYFVIFGRMSYSIFMIHYFVIAHFMSSPNQNVSFSIFETFYRAAYVYVVSIFLGIVLFLTVEAPFVGLLKSLAGKGSKVKSDDQGKCD